MFFLACFFIKQLPFLGFSVVFESNKYLFVGGKATLGTDFGDLKEVHWPAFIKQKKLGSCFGGFDPYPNSDSMFNKTFKRTKTIQYI